MSFQRFSNSIAGNLALITVGSLVFAFGVKAIAVPHGFISGGLTGLGLLIYYATNLFTPGLWYFILNAPVFLVAWIFVGKRFFFYSIYGMLCVSIAIDFFSYEFAIRDTMLAACTCGAILGAGGGIVLHSLGSCGGGDIIAVILNQKFNIRMGTFFFSFNLCLYAVSFAFLDNDLILYSLVLSFVCSQVLDSVLTVFNQRKFVMIISDSSEAIAHLIGERLNRGATFVDGQGAYSGRTKRILLTVVNNLQLKRLEEIVFSEDPEAFVVIEKTFNVFGRGFSKRKQYS
jgi:uncharacterized membrane-anchored protein YitT (DUF2179 family)